MRKAEWPCGSSSLNGKENLSYFWPSSFSFDLIFRKSALLDIFLIRILASWYSNQKYRSWNNICVTCPVQSHWYVWIPGSEAGPLGVHGPIFPTTMQNAKSHYFWCAGHQAGVSVCPGLYWHIQAGPSPPPSPGAWSWNFNSILGFRVCQHPGRTKAQLDQV